MKSRIDTLEFIRNDRKTLNFSSRDIRTGILPDTLEIKYISWGDNIKEMNRATLNFQKIKSPKRSSLEHSFAQKYRLNLTKSQIKTLVQWGGSLRLISNVAKEERDLRHQMNKNRPFQLRENINSFSQLYSLPEIKSLPGYEFLNEIPSQVLQQSLMDLNKSYQNFFKNGTGFPKWKTRVRDGVQLRFPDGKNVKVSKLNKNKSEVILPKIGSLKFKTSGRQIPKNARIRSCTIRGNADGSEFFVSFNLGLDEVEFKKTIPKNDGPAVGGDRGIKIAMQLSDGESFIFPHKSIAKLKNKIKMNQKKLAKQKKPSRVKSILKNSDHRATKYKLRQEKIRKLHGKIKNIRLDFNHKLTTQIAKNHGLVVLEDLRLKNMSKSAKGTIEKPGKMVKQKSGLNRELLNIGIGMMEQMLDYKCRWHGSHLVLVNPKNSSRECSKCGHTSKQNRKSQSIFKCISCNHEENADLNAAKVILARGRRVLACGENISVLDENSRTKKFSKGPKGKETRTSEKSSRKTA